MSSLSELQLEKYSKGTLIDYCKDLFLRTYPKGTRFLYSVHPIQVSTLALCNPYFRVDSSNYNPNLAWEVGAQMVALNYQTAGKMMYVSFRRSFKSATFHFQSPAAVSLFTTAGRCGCHLQLPGI